MSEHKAVSLEEMIEVIRNALIYERGWTPSENGRSVLERRIATLEAVIANLEAQRDDGR